MSNTPVYLRAEAEIEIPFHDCDPMQVVWHGNYARYFEVARGKLLDLIEFNYDAMEQSGFAWPIVDMRTKYVRPLLFRQTIIVKAELIEYESRIKIRYVIIDKRSGEKLTSGYTTQVAVCIEKREMQYVSPDVLVNKIRNFENKK
jgi:acyl-CoA thioester hydrolase